MLRGRRTSCSKAVTAWSCRSPRLVLTSGQYVEEVRCNGKLCLILRQLVAPSGADDFRNVCVGVISAGVAVTPIKRVLPDCDGAGEAPVVKPQSSREMTRI